MKMRAALLVIDIQKDNISENGPYPFPLQQVTSLINNSNQLVAACEAAQIPVIFVRQIFDGFAGRLISRLFLGGITQKGTPGAELDERLIADYGEVLDKPTQDAFARTDLDRRLQAFGVNHLYLAGLDGAYCVSATAKGGLKSGRAVTFIDDSILTNKPQKWGKLKAGLINQGARSCSAAQFISEVAPAPSTAIT